MLNRQNFDVKKYNAAYAAAFGGVYKPAAGPPNAYNTPNDDGAVGGNPAVGPMLKAGIIVPNPNEAGWKDTIMAPPGQVTRFIVRFAPTDATAQGLSGYPFDPSTGRRTSTFTCTAFRRDS